MKKVLKGMGVLFGGLLLLLIFINFLKRQLEEIDVSGGVSFDWIERWLPNIELSLGFGLGGLLGLLLIARLFKGEATWQKAIRGILHAFAVLLLLATAAFSDIGTWVGAQFGQIERAASSAALELERGITIHLDRIITIPPQSVTDGITVSEGRCLRWQMADAGTTDIPETEIQRSLENPLWIPLEGTSNQSFYAIRFRNETDRDMRVHVHIRNAGQCNTW